MKEDAAKRKFACGNCGILLVKNTKHIINSKACQKFKDKEISRKSDEEKKRKLDDITNRLTSSSSDTDSDTFEAEI